MATTFIYLPPTGASNFWQDPVANVAALPASGNYTGEIIHVLSPHSLSYWDGAAWQTLLAGPAGTYVLKAGDTMSGDLTISTLTASRALVTNGTKVLTSSATTDTEIGYVSGVTSAIQTQLGTKAAGAASSTDNAVARFDATTGKVVQNSGVIIDDSNNVSGAATAAIGGALVTSTVLTLTSTTGALLLPRMTTTQRDALTATDGMVLYNSTTNKVQVRENGAWGDTTGWGS
jgi:hypothetical protein